MAEEPNILQPASNFDEKGKVKQTEGQPEGHDFPGEMIPHSNNRDCETEYGSGWGKFTQNYPMVWFGNMSEEEWEQQNALYPGACKPWVHNTATIPFLRSTTIEAFTSIITPTLSGPGSTECAINGVASGNKILENFDIPHVKNPKKRIRHIIAEGPEAGIYVRGRLSGENVIKLPEYWDGLIDPSTITVTLTQIRTSQDLIVDAIEWGKVIKIKSGNASAIDCFYEVWAARWLNPMDHSEKLHVVYEGDSPADYPGNNEMFLVGGWDYDRRETKWRRPEDEVDSVDLDADS
jgi:hypothetical protein